MEELLYVIIYEKQCVIGCSDKEIRLCRAYTKKDAETIAKAHGKKFFKGWSISIQNVYWDEDDTAFVFCDIQG